MEDFSNPAAVNTLLGNLLRQLARKRIARPDAIAIAYVSQLLLGSIAALDRRELLAQRAADHNDAIPPRLVFDPPDDPAPISDSTRLPVPSPTFTTQNTEGRP